MSRRPPSQRDPAFANSRAAKVVSQLVPGRHRTTNAAPLPFKATTKARGLVPQPPAPAGGGGSLVLDSSSYSLVYVDDSAGYPADTDTDLRYDTTGSTLVSGVTFGGFGSNSKILFAEAGLYHCEMWAATISEDGATAAPVFGLEVDMGLGNTQFSQSVPYHNRAEYQSVYSIFDVPIPAALDTYLSISMDPYGAGLVPYTDRSDTTKSNIDFSLFIYKTLAT